MKNAALIVVVLATLAATGLLADLLAAQTTALAAEGSASNVKLSIEVANLDTGQPIQEREAVAASTRFQVTVRSDGVDCAGQFVVSALGAPGAPPAVLVEFVPFVIGSASSATGSQLTAGVLPGAGGNDFKVSASCNGTAPKSFGHGEFEFFVDPPGS